MNVLPPKIKFTLTTAPREVSPYVTYVHRYSKVVDGEVVNVTDSMNNEHGVKVPAFVNTFHYEGALQSLGADVVGPSVIFLDVNKNVLGSFWATTNSLNKVDLPIPAGTDTILAPCIIYATPIFRFSLQEYDVTTSVINTDDVSLIGDRDGTSDVLLSVSYPLKFGVNSDGYNILHDQFMNYGIRADVTLNIYEKAYFDETYTLLQSAPIEFPQYREYETYIEVASIDSSLNALIRAKGGINYDIPVSSLATENWQYEDIRLNEYARYQITDTELTVSSPNYAASVPMVSPTGDNIYRVPGSIKHNIKGQTFKPSPGGTEYFIKADENVTISLHADLSAEFIIDCPQQYLVGSILYKTKPEKFEAHIEVRTAQNGQLVGEPVIEVVATPYKWVENDNDKTYTIYVHPVINKDASKLLVKGLGLSLIVWVKYTVAPMPVLWNNLSFAFTDGSSLFLYFPATFPADSGYPIKVIDPVKLLQKFLDLMAETPQYQTEYTGQILWPVSQKYKYRIVAAESIANYDTPYFHGNMNDFIKWMKVLGFEQHYNAATKTLTFLPRDNLYQKGEIIDLSESEVSDLAISPATDVLYSSVKAGCEKEDYDNEYLNGIEINAEFQYTTGLTNIDQELDLVSPYRADAIGIQNLYRSFKEPTIADRQDADSDIFAVVLNNNGTTYMGSYIEAYDQLTGGTISLFNALLSGPYIVKNNESLIGMSTEKLIFSSTSGNKNGSIDGISIDADRTLSKKLFTPIIYSFKEGSLDFPSYDWFNALTSVRLIVVTWHGKQLRGFVKNIARTLGNETERDWELYAES